MAQDMKFLLSLTQHAEKYGATNAAMKYKTSRQYVYRRKRRYDGSIESLRDIPADPTTILTGIACRNRAYLCNVIKR